MNLKKVDAHKTNNIYNLYNIPNIILMYSLFSQHGVTVILLE
jgi:hypothetical protein